MHRSVASSIGSPATDRRARGGGTFEQRRSLVRLLLPTGRGYYVKLHKDRRIEVKGIIPTPMAALEMKMMVSSNAG